MAKRDKVNKNK